MRYELFDVTLLIWLVIGAVHFFFKGGDLDKGLFRLDGEVGLAYGPGVYSAPGTAG